MLVKVFLLAVVAFACLANASDPDDAPVAVAVADNYNSPLILGDKEYHLGIVQKVNWYRAGQICASLGMSLASIESGEELQKLSIHMFTNRILADTFWLSGSDLALGKEYTWLASGNKFTFTNWATGQPNGNNHCVRTNGNALLQWETANCVLESYYICSRPLVPDCGANGSCYYRYRG